jgi:hypothetical protein
MKNRAGIFLGFLFIFLPLTLQGQPAADMSIFTVDQMVDALKAGCVGGNGYEFDRSVVAKEIRLRGISDPMVLALVHLCMTGTPNEAFAAMCLLADIKAKEASPFLTTLALGADTSKTGWAMAKLGLLRDPVNIPALTQIFHTATVGDFKSVAMVQLGELQATSLIPEFQALLTDFNSSMAAFALAEMGSSQGRDTALQNLNNNKHYLDADALKALGEIGDPRDLPYVEQLTTEFTNDSGWTTWEAIVHFQIEIKALTPAERVKKMDAFLFSDFSATRKATVDWCIDWLDRENSAPATGELKKLLAAPIPFDYRLDIAQILRSRGMRVAYQKSGMDYAFMVGKKAGKPVKKN